MNRDDATEYTKALGMIAEGAYRKVALGIRLGVHRALGMKREEWVAQIGTMNLTRHDRQEAVKSLTADNHSNREIADILGVAESTVRNDRAQNCANEPPHSAQNNAELKAERRAERERSLAARQRAMPMLLYGVIYGDPPWRFEPFSRDTGLDRAADNHYPTMELGDIKALQVPAAPDCVLFLWATVPMLPQALEVMSAWGFVYRSHFAWIRAKIGTGYWTRNAHELLLIGTRGNIPAPAMGEQYASVITAPATAHSAKPFCFREMIEEMFPNLPRIELFARERFVGWDSWGNEVDKI